MPASIPAVAPRSAGVYSLAAISPPVNAVGSLTAAESIPNAMPADRLKPVRIWLYVVALMVLAMVMVGGITRLTDSGLSITEWQPISGAIPPLRAADWQAEFDNYKKITQYTVLNEGLSLEAFK